MLAHLKRCDVRLPLLQPLNQLDQLRPAHSPFHHDLLALAQEWVNVHLRRVAELLALARAACVGLVRGRRRVQLDEHSFLRRREACLRA